MRLRRRDVHSAGDLRYEPIGSSHSSTYGFKLSQQDVPNDVIADKILAVSMRERFDEFITVEACAPDYKSRAPSFFVLVEIHTGDGTSISFKVHALDRRHALRIVDDYYDLVQGKPLLARKFWQRSRGKKRQ